MAVDENTRHGRRSGQAAHHLLDFATVVALVQLDVVDFVEVQLLELLRNRKRAENGRLKRWPTLNGPQLDPPGTHILGGHTVRTVGLREDDDAMVGERFFDELSYGT